MSGQQGRKIPSFRIHCQNPCPYEFIRTALCAVVFARVFVIVVVFVIVMCSRVSQCMGLIVILRLFEDMPMPDLGSLWLGLDDVVKDVSKISTNQTKYVGRKRPRPFTIIILL